MKIRILGWKYQNIRGGLRDLEINLGSPLPRWSLIQMPNGMGKTTTMALFRAILTQEPLTPDQVRDLRADDEASTGEFHLRALVDDKLHRLEMHLNFAAGTVAYWTTRSELKSGGKTEGIALPDELRRLLSKEFARLFIFDGELAKEIRAEGRERAAASIMTLYRLDRLTELSAQVRRLVKDQQDRAAAISTAKGDKGVTRWQNQVATLQATSAKLAKQLKERKAREKDLIMEQDVATARIGRHLEDDEKLRARKAELDVARTDIDKNVSGQVSESLSMLRTPARADARFLSRLTTLGERLAHLQLPKSTSRSFFRDLANQEACVCGRPLGDAERVFIREHADLYLAEDQIAVINAVKGELLAAATSQGSFSTAVDGLKGSLKARQKNQSGYDQLEAERIQSGDSEVEKLRQQIEDAKDELEQVELDIDRLTTSDPFEIKKHSLNASNNLIVCALELKRASAKLETATHTREFTGRAERLEELIADVVRRALERLRERVRESTNKHLEQLMPTENIRVSQIAGSLELSSDRQSRKSGVSEGQSLAVAYAFLSSLLAEAPYNLPFVVDSPAVSLDTRVRREVGELIPPMFDQMIMFVISSERSGFADAFYGLKDVKYLTLFRELNMATECREGVEFFRTFHDKEADE